MTKRAAFWAGVWTAGGFVDWTFHRKHNGWTFSEVIRWLFRTDTPAGRAVFTVSLAGGTYAFWRHICKE